MLIIKADRCVGDDLVMNTSLYVLHNQDTAQDYRHETLDAALDALNAEVGERDLWVLVELDRVGAGRRIAEGRGPIKRPRSPGGAEREDAPAADAESAFGWRRLEDRRVS
jgi:hypothetical protein